jgi:hypothetical protein
MVAAVSALCVLSLPSTASAVSPEVVWTAPGMSASVFSADGPLALAIANTSAGGAPPGRHPCHLCADRRAERLRRPRRKDPLI